MRAAVLTGAFTPSHRTVATTVKHVVDESVRRGDDLLVVTPGAGTSPHPTTYRGVRVARPADPSGLLRELAAFDPEVLHLADPRLLGTGVVQDAIAYGHQHDVPVVASHHSIGGDRWGEWWSSISGTGADLTLATCLAAQDALDAAGVHAALWRPGVDADLFTPAMRTPELAARWSRGDRLVVGYVGEVSRAHVVRRLVDVGTLPGVRLVVARAGDQAERFRTRLPDARVLGDVSGVDLAHVVASCDVLVQPRRKELDAHAVRRALAAGVPVAGLDAGGTTDVVAHEVNGLLVDASDRHGLRGAVQRLRDDAALRTRLAEQARASVACRGWDDAVEELVDVHWAAALVGTAAA